MKEYSEIRGNSEEILKKYRESGKELSEPFLVMLDSGENNKHCDLYPHGSIHKVVRCQKGHLWLTTKIDSISDRFSKLELISKPETKTCPECKNEFPDNWIFIFNKHCQSPSCIRCFERYNNLHYSDRDNYREAIRAELMTELNAKGKLK
jgi:hypothetical protein